MLVTLIRPPSMTAKWVPGMIATPPLAHAYLAGMLTSQGHDVKVIDAVGEALHQKTSLDDMFAIYGLTASQVVERIPANVGLIGISCMFTQEWPNVRRLAREIKAAFPQTPIVVGGEHVTAESEFSLRDLPEISAVISGEGEETLLEVANHLEKGVALDALPGLAFLKDGQFVKNPARARIKAIDDIPWPRWDLTPIENYLDEHLGFGVSRGRSMPLLATRGCPYRCTFCSSPQMWTTKWTARDPKDVVKEIEFYMAKYGATNFDFYDLTAIVKREWIIDFSKMLIERGYNITWQLPSGTRSEALDEEVCTLLYQSGCRNITYAPESGSTEVLKRIKKMVKPSRMLQSMKDALNSGLNVKYNLIFGFPGETHREIWQSLIFVIRTALIGVHDLSIWLFSPYPGSELFNELKEKITMDEKYFLSLSAYSDFSQAVSWNPGMSARTLKFYRLSGTALFYATVYISRPWRVFQMAKHLMTGQHESRLESIIAAMWRRVAKPAAVAAS